MCDYGHARPADLICLSHLRWNFVFQRPHHLLTRCARERRCYYVEEPLYDAERDPFLTLDTFDGVHVVVPHLVQGCDDEDAVECQRRLLDELIQSEHIEPLILWYYTPMALPFTDHLEAAIVVFDCMDELSGFAQAPAAMRLLEARLLRRATLVLTGGHSLYEAKRNKHPNVHAMPSSVDVDHFARAREPRPDPSDQAGITRPRLGFFGVIDERMDLPLVAQVAASRPSWQIIMIGPVVKIDPAVLPRAGNIHYLGPKSYQRLPQYIAGWDVALLPFARNEATRFISPTKTPEYLAAGKPVVSTSIRDVERPYGQQGLARIADTPLAFIRACEEAMAEDPAARLREADAFLRQTSWDGTWAQVRHLMETALTRTTTLAPTADAI